MIISNKNRYIFIAVPKTGTSSIEKLLLEKDPSARKYGTEIDGKYYKFGDHDTALQIKKILGENYTDFRTFGFIRNPYSRIVSSYFFYKQGGKRKQNRDKKRILRELRIQTARLLPFKIWSIFYPYKSNKEYFVDENGELIVDFIGTFEDLNQEFERITKKIGLHFRSDDLPHVNKSNHKDVNKYFLNKSFNRFINLKIGDDLDFYNRYAHQID